MRTFVPHYRWIMGDQLVLVVDDDEAICDTVEDGLHLSGFRTIRAIDGAAALSAIVENRPDLVILDVNLPRMDGFEVLKRVRADGATTPVIMLTARHEKNDTVHGLKLGADDYVHKPFGLEELLLRVQAVLRRAAGAAPRVLTCGPLRIDIDSHEVRVGDEVVNLSPTEFRLLSYLVERKGRVVSKEQILEAVWNIDFESGTTVVETFISYLRRKLGPEVGALIKTVRGVGFRMVEVA